MTTMAPTQPPVLTARQADVLRWVTEYYVSHGYGPTYREIGGRFGMTSTNGPVSTVAALVRKGALVVPTEFTARAIIPAGYVVVRQDELNRLKRLAGEAP
jgi:SOS-response transcriptional repressor LexA